MASENLLAEAAALTLMAAEVRAVANRCASLIWQRSRAQAEEIRQSASRCEPLIQPLWDEKLRNFQPYLACGSPPSIMHLVGLSHLEKPFNRLLRWCADERGEHGFGREFLSLLCRRLGFTKMTLDLDGEEPIELWGEEAIDSSGNMPDLVVRTPHAALMLENKVQSGESGDQYNRYYDWFPHFAGQRETFTVLSAPGGRPTPDGWSRYLSHEELTEVFCDLARKEDVPFWGRVVAIQCAVTLERREHDQIAELIRATRHKGRPSMLDWQTVLAFRPTNEPRMP